MAENKEKSMSFEQALGDLEKIVTEIEQGKILLEQSLEKYAQGMKLIGHCRGVLDQAEKRIETISIEMPTARQDK